MARRKSSQKAYFGLDWVISLILAIILPLNTICGIVTRIMRQNWLGLVLNIIAFPVFWVIDIVTIIAHKDLTIMA